jgi:hypothetical protein
MFRDSIQSITKQQICELAAVVDITSVCGLIFEHVRGILKVNLENLLRNVLWITGHHRRLTILAQDVFQAVIMQIKPSLCYRSKIYLGVAFAKASVSDWIRSKCLLRDRRGLLSLHDSKQTDELAQLAILLDVATQVLQQSHMIGMQFAHL